MKDYLLEELKWTYKRLPKQPIRDIYLPCKECDWIEKGDVVTYSVLLVKFQKEECGFKIILVQRFNELGRLILQ